MFSKILIANRGEIALRIIRACKELGIRTVAVYSQADKNSLHVRFADEAVCIGQPASSKSYLNIPSIISAAEITDVEAIHPGYGFLAENSHFAEICESCNIKFIGPTAENIRMMGDKMNARNTMQKAGLPIIPGSTGIIKNKDEAVKIAKRIGYPVIIKASAGGGGKGMRICHNDITLASSFMTAQSEAEVNFGNPAVYIEKYLEKPRHIEIQILADNYGHVLHLGERDCSIQRRHQKLLEESPSLAVDSKLRKRLGELAVKAAKALNYSNVGTMEFLLDKHKNFYFMEMNTRIQVEHSVTEMVTGIDMIKEQIYVASGGKLKIRQDDIKFKGAAIECRINAEDYENNFMPSPGKIETLNLPGGPGVRVDTHIYPGYEIPTYYDSLIAKLIVHGNSREEAIMIMRRALNEFIIGPIKSTVNFHIRLLDNPLFLKGDISTHFVQEMLAEVFEKTE
ncbi:MAG: acetyl-CoA carboxylase biotin carboxylase subunit [Candidatus Omnitrophota bacterium]|nr:acetyl-CoA carboxylase biotin carboxylase subunit [Candidatus Omnitrophota bacterium]MBU1929112.1 acetyl-CoA carboxylase biotin carboxylase subunit [Candidatus Omnitrophota bacterium]MBU1929137.1 acetyl-CoA carboxylase biotin carboxylase subunit [Candidatus Omnitrophota bacterium]MBU2035017.1 acetyl-CoA carboxylase biotin carboxylase subunit [Candidatus Omnitrophota bacterium]MBU2222017.1 acetyl-CoA carboxylase biotin carboxylase subunit [Candidatus Omnitrophota bacterium]